MKRCGAHANRSRAFFASEFLGARTHGCAALLAATLLSASAAAQSAPPASAVPAPGAAGENVHRIASADGQTVTITTTQRDAMVYLAKGNVPMESAPGQFENVGVAPVTLKLAPGNYTIEIAGPTISDGHATFAVQDAPLRIEVRPGNASIKTFGGVLIALGVSAVIAGIIVLVTYTQKEGSFDKAAIAVPLLAGGGAAGLGGIGLTLVGTTRIDVPRSAGVAPPNAGPPLHAGTAWVPGLRLQF